jgi:hypothetical protein
MGTHKMKQRYGSISLVMAFTVGLSLLAAVSTAAQETDGRWIAYYGCWEPLDETVDRGVLCVRPEAGGIEIYTVVDGVVTTSDVVVADGERRELSVEGCDGWESAKFSSDGRRVFTSSAFVCGEETPRSASGIMSLVSPTSWLDVRSVDVDGEKVAWVQNYRLVGPERMAEVGVEDITAEIGMSVRTSRMAASREIRIDDVTEASEVADAKAVEAWIAATGDRFDVDADMLISMADAGVPETVIDVVVAVSYPETFSIDADAQMQQRPMSTGRRAGVFGDGYGLGIRRGLRYGGYGYGAGSFFFDPFYYGYTPYRSSYGYGYGNYGYPYGGYQYTPTTVIVTTRAPANTPRGRVVNGRGYTRSGGNGSARTGSQPRSTQGSASSGGSRSSGGSSGTRTAKPRGGRGGR